MTRNAGTSIGNVSFLRCYQGPKEHKASYYIQRVGETVNSVLKKGISDGLKRRIKDLKLVAQISGADSREKKEERKIFIQELIALNLLQSDKMSERLISDIGTFNAFLLAFPDEF